MSTFASEEISCHCRLVGIPGGCYLLQSGRHLSVSPVVRGMFSKYLGRLSLASLLAASGHGGSKSGRMVLAA